MIRSNPIKFIPKLDYTEYAWKELSLVDDIKAIELGSEFITVVTQDETPLFTMGVIRHSLISSPRFWFLLCESFRGRTYWNLRALKNVIPELDRMYPHLETLVAADWLIGLKFAKFCGFKATDRFETAKGRTFRVMER